MVAVDDNGCEDSHIIIIIWSSHQSIRTSYSSCIRRRRINILHNARLISDGVRHSMLAVMLITIVGAMMVHVFCPGDCLRTGSFARLIFSFLRAAQKRASPAKTAGYPFEWNSSRQVDLCAAHHLTVLLSYYMYEHLALQ